MFAAQKCTGASCNQSNLGFGELILQRVIGSKTIQWHWQSHVICPWNTLYSEMTTSLELPSFFYDMGIETFSHSELLLLMFCLQVALYWGAGLCTLFLLCLFGFLCQSLTDILFHSADTVLSNNSWHSTGPNNKETQEPEKIKTIAFSMFL